jgi:hypothetical protein
MDGGVLAADDQAQEIDDGGEEQFSGVLALGLLAEQGVESLTGKSPFDEGTRQDGQQAAVDERRHSFLSIEGLAFRRQRPARDPEG